MRMKWCNDDVQRIGLSWQMPYQCIDMRFDVVAIGLTGLGRHIADVHLQRIALDERFCQALYEQVRHDARIQRAGAKHDQVRLEDGADRLRLRSRVLGLQVHALDRFADLRNMRLSAHL